jgi:hypothetical protein
VACHHASPDRTTLERALEKGYKVGQTLVRAELIDTILAKDIDELEPRLTHHGHHMKALAG